MKEGFCKLCQLSKPLLKKSHIIPDFLYKEFYNDNHKLKRYSLYDVLEGRGKLKLASTGIYQGGILCKQCDNDIIGGYETYAAKVAYGGNNFGSLPTPTARKFRSSDGVTFTQLKDVDYRNFKLFLLSILWRASISTNKFFDEVNLGPHEEVLRKMILEGNPGEKSDYPIMMVYYREDKSVPNMIIQPVMKKAEGFRTYSFPIGGISYVFYVGSHSLKPRGAVLFSTIGPENEMNIFHTLPDKGWELLHQHFALPK